MKKWLFSLCLFTALFELRAQIQKGDLSLNGNFTPYYQSAEGNASSDYGLGGTGMTAALMFSDHIMGGLSLEDNFNQDHPVFFGRYYLNPASERFNFFVGSELEVDFDAEEVEFSPSVGANHFISESLSLEAKLRYSMLTERRNVLGLDFGLRSFISAADRANKKTAISTFSAGTMMLGIGQVQLAATEISVQAGLHLEGGYFMTDRWLLGVADEFIYTRFDGFVDDRILKGTFNDLMLFTRYYLRPAGRRLVPFAEIGAGTLISRGEVTGDYNFRNSREFVEGTVGFNLFTNETVALEFGLQARQWGRTAVTQDNLGNAPDIDETIADKAFELGLNVGVQFFLNQ